MLHRWQSGIQVGPCYFSINFENVSWSGTSAKVVFYYGAHGCETVASKESRKLFLSPRRKSGFGRMMSQ